MMTSNFSHVSDNNYSAKCDQPFAVMLRERNTFVLKARSGRDERQHALTLNVNVREQDLSHFKKSGEKAMQVLTFLENFCHK